MKHIDRYILSERARLPREAAKIILEKPELLAKAESDHNEIMLTENAGAAAPILQRVGMWLVQNFAFDFIKDWFMDDDDDDKKDDKKDSGGSSDKDDDGFDPLSVLGGDDDKGGGSETISSGDNQEIIVEPDGTVRIIRGGGAGRKGRKSGGGDSGGDGGGKEEESSGSATGTLIGIGIAILIALGFRGIRNKGNPDLETSNAIGGAKYFKAIGLKPNYAMLRARIRFWAQNKGDMPRAWELMDRVSIRMFLNKVLINQELWRRVHERQDEINRIANGDKGFFGGIWQDFKDELGGPLGLKEIGIPGLGGDDDDDGVMGKIAKARKLQKALDFDKNLEEDEEAARRIKMLLDVYNRESKSGHKILEAQHRATMIVIQEEYERLADELKDKEDIDILDKWDGSDIGAETMRWAKVKGREGLNKVDVFDWFDDVTELERRQAETSDGEAFRSFFLPGLALIYDKWIHDQLKTKLKDLKPRPAGPVPSTGDEPEDTEEVPTPAAAEPPKEATKAEKQAVILDKLGLDLSVIQSMLFAAGYFGKPSDKLRTFGYSSRRPLKADNKYGPETEEAIMNLQKNLNSKGSSLKVDGLYGPDTHEAYKKNPINADGSLPQDNQAKASTSGPIEISKTSKVKRGDKFYVTVSTTDGKEFLEIGDDLKLTTAAARDKAEAYIKTLPLQERKISNIHKILSRKLKINTGD